jgi:uncharacterized protein YukE
VTGNTVYDYNAIAECNRAFKTEIGMMHEDIDRFQKEVSDLVTNTWGGVAAEQYNVAADGLNNDLQHRTDTLMNLERTLGSSADNMQDADHRGGNRIAGSV